MCVAAGEENEGEISRIWDLKNCGEDKARPAFRVLERLWL